MIKNGVHEYSICMPARIVEYFVSDQTATVELSVEKIHSNIEVTDKLETRALLYDVPVHTAYGGGFAITFPIKKGDTCLMQFSQVGYDHWLFEDRDTAGYLAGRPKPTMYRAFSEDDGFCTVGFNTLPRKITGVSPVHSVWRDKSLESSIKIKDDGDIEVIAGAVEVFISKVANTVVMNVPTSVTINTPLTTVNGDMVLNGDFTHIGDHTQTGNSTQVGDRMQTGKNVRVGDQHVTGATKHTGVLEVTSAVPNPNVLADLTI